MGKETILILDSNSKVNLGLKVINKRPDNFHNIESIFIEINLKDKLTFTPCSKFKLITKGISIPNNENNTIIQATQLIENTFNIKVKHKILIDKNIPTGSGLGGGSSNAAMTLIGLNKLYKLNITNNHLQDLASKISSDAPFFINGKVQFIQGRGERMSPIKNTQFKNKKFLLVFPNFRVSTSWAYSNIKKYLHTNTNPPKFPALTNESDWALFENNFEKVVGSTYPEILEIKDVLYKYGAHYSGLSGSGSTMFGIYTDEALVQKTQEALVSYQTFIATPVIE